jgi:ABC-type branched-subunit amino acid transport system substrate-binding protein
MKRLLARLIVAVAVAFGTASLSHAEILIGLVNIQTGRMANAYQDQLLQGAELAVAKLNAAGGVSAST